MAFFSVRLQRLALYLLLVLTVILLYQIYSHGGGLAKRRQLRGEYAKILNSNYVKTPEKDDVLDEAESKGNVRRKEIDMERSNAQLVKEVKRLQSRINKREELIYRLTAELEKEKLNVKKFKQEVGNLKVQNAELLAEMESHSLGEHSGRGEQIRSDDTRDNSPASTKEELDVQVSGIRISERVPFQSFAKTHVFEVSQTLRPKEYIFHGQDTNMRRLKSGRKHFLEAQNVAINFINSNTSYRVSRDNVVDGVYRFDINVGMDYELYFKDPSSSKYLAVRLIRLLGPMQPVAAPTERRKPRELINLILPLSGRIERFQQFIDNFVEVGIKKDNHVFLTVVLYGAKDFNYVKSTLKDLEASYGFKKYQLIMRDKPFSRGRALHDGVMYWSGKPRNILLFFCDVDITFRPDFLRRCRMYAEPQKKVYYPMVFSLYNPKNVYEDGTIPPPSQQLIIERTHGFWRAYGFGMTCQYRSDYLRVGGFDLNIEGWGSEDLGLYEKLLQQSDIRIIRAPDRDLFHYFHEKKCDPSLSNEQYRSCLGSKAIAEGTHTQIAMQLSKLREKYESDSQQDDAD